MMNTSTGQFHVANMGQQFEAGSAVARGATLYYLVAGGEKQVKVDTCDIADLRSGDVASVKASAVWKSFELAARVQASNGASFRSYFRPAAVLSGQTIYFFWADSASNQVYAVSMDRAGALSSSPYKIYVRGSPTPSRLQVTSYLAASVAPNGADIILNWFDYGSAELGSLALDPKKIDTESRQWAGNRGSSLKPADYGLASVNHDFFRISTAWFTQGSQRNFMIASFYSSDAHRAYFLLYPIRRDGTPAETGSAHVFKINDLSAKRGFTLSRDPASRIHGISCDDDAETNIVIRNFNTNQSVEKDSSGKDPVLSWGAKSNLNGISKGSEKAPVMAFVAGVSNASTVTIPVPGQAAQTHPGTDVRHYGFAFYAAGTQNREAYDVQCQVAFYGTSSIIPNFARIDPEADYVSARLLSIVLDTFPFPNQNLGTSVPGTRKIIEYTYGASSSTLLSTMFSTQSLFGVKNTFTTTAGIGLAAEAEYRSGPQGSVGSTTTETVSVGYSVATTPFAPDPSAPTRFKVEEHGQYFGTTPSSFVETIAIFKDVGGAIVNGAEAPLFSVIRPVPGSETIRVTGQYGTYCYTPGDIFSYGKNAIDATMARLYGKLSNKNKVFLSPGYASGYIDGVIIPNARTFPNGKNFLEFTIGGSGGSGAAFESISEALATMGIVLKARKYFGVSGGGMLSLFGILVLEGFSGSTLRGADYETSITAGVGNTTSWGIAFTNNAPSAVSGAYGYSVKMYVCEPSNLWAREIQLFAKGDVDAGSAIDYEASMPSKIMFVVSNIERTRDPHRREETGGT